MLSNTAYITKDAVIAWAAKRKEAAEQKNAEFLNTLPSKHNNLAWNGYSLPANDYIIQVMQNIIDYFDREEVTDADVAPGLQSIQEDIIAEQIRYTGEGSQNPGHAFERYGMACARADLLGSGYLQFKPFRPAA